MTDPRLELLERLPSARLDVSRTTGIRTRCHAALADERHRIGRTPPPMRPWPSIVVGLGGLYLTELARQVLSMYGIV